MSTQVNAQYLQNMQVGISGPDGANTLIIASGIANCSLNVSTSGPGSQNTQRGSYSVLLEPALTQPQFRRAIATGALASISYNHSDITQQAFVAWTVESVEAHWDDDSGKIELQFDVSVTVGMGGSYGVIAEVAFQVMTLAAL